LTTPERGDQRADVLRVALCSGILVRHDAISDSLRTKLDLLERWCAGGRPVEVVAFVQHTDGRRPAVAVTPTAAALAGHPAFAAAHLHVFEFGIHYDLFDAAFLVRPPARRIAVYHNVTPLELVEGDIAGAAVARALRQKANLELMDHVACDSEYNRDDLIAFGLPPERLSVLHLPAPSPGVVRAPGRPRDQRVELLFVGRFVRSKGVLDLLEAVGRLHEREPGSFRLTLAGNQTFSDPAVLAAVREVARRAPSTVRFAGEPDDRRLAELMAASDVLVIPSYHEGYCLPVVEAYAFGCQVTAYDAGNLPNVVGHHGLVVPTGEVDALTAALREQIVALSVARRADVAAKVPTIDGPVEADAWRRNVAEHLRAYSAEAYERGFRELVVAQARQLPTVSPEVVEALARA
jgi:glycosyltransferase involved in cell wall biosynthesis